MIGYHADYRTSRLQAQSSYTCFESSENLEEPKKLISGTVGTYLPVTFSQHDVQVVQVVLDGSNWSCISNLSGSYFYVAELIQCVQSDGAFV